MPAFSFIRFCIYQILCCQFYHYYHHYYVFYYYTLLATRVIHCPSLVWYYSCTTVLNFLTCLLLVLYRFFGYYLYLLLLACLHGLGTWYTSRMSIHAVLLFRIWGHLGLYALSRWRHKVYDIYMRVSFFGLFYRCTNFMNPSTEFVQLVLLHLRITHCLMSHFMLVCVCSWCGFWYMLSRVGFYWCTYVYLCTPLDTYFTTHWLVFLTLMDLHVQILEFGLKWILPPRTELILQSRLTSCRSFLSISSDQLTRFLM